MQPRPRPRQRQIHAAALVAAASLLVMTAQSAAVALPAQSAQSPSADPEFTSSFEADEAQPDWRNTVETGARRHEALVRRRRRLRKRNTGQCHRKVTDLRASDENTGGGETKENLVDVRDRAPNGWRSSRRPGSSSTWTLRSRWSPMP